MYSGYVLLCDSRALGQCVSRKIYHCTDSKHRNEVSTIKKNSVLFFYSPESRTLVGPFTAASQGAEKIEPGAWDSDIDPHTESANIRLAWTELHELKNADERFPFLRDLTKCELSALWTHTLIDALRNAPAFEAETA